MTTPKTHKRTNKGKRTNKDKRSAADTNADHPSACDAREMRLFRACDTQNRGCSSREEIEDFIWQAGIRFDDQRIASLMQALQQKGRAEPIEPESFFAMVRPNIALFEQMVQGNMVIPDFRQFCDQIDGIYKRTKANTDGNVADYIPQLGRVAPDQYGVAVCTVEGQQHAIGDYGVDFCVQSCCKPINYCLALEEHGEDKVHQYIGREPSGRGFNELTLNHDGRPHNPMINSGAIMSCSLLKPELDTADRFDFIMNRWRALSGGKKAGFSNSVYLSERRTADRNFALGYFMQENRAFPPNTNMVETLEFYFQCCSIEMDAQRMSVVAGALANGGVCPVTGVRIFSSRTVQNCLSLMSSCGMYDFSGEFAFTIGLPAKSGVAGALLIVVPNVMGVCTWSPRLDRMGNSVRGIAFCEDLVRLFNFHNYDNLTGLSEKLDPRKPHLRTQSDDITALIWAASKGDLLAIRQLQARSVDCGSADYDGRTPLHLAAAEGHLNVVEYLLALGVDSSPKDRWGGSPLDDAKKNDQQPVVDRLTRHLATFN